MNIIGPKAKGGSVEPLGLYLDGVYPKVSSKDSAWFSLNCSQHGSPSITRDDSRIMVSVVEPKPGAICISAKGGGRRRSPLCPVIFGWK